MRFFGKKEAPRPPPPPGKETGGQPITENMDVVQRLLAKIPQPNTLQGIQKRAFDEILNGKELPSIGHALDRVQPGLRERLAPSALIAYEKGYLHMIPNAMGDAGEILNVGFTQKNRSENMENYESFEYTYPGKFLLLELTFPQEMEKITKHEVRTVPKDDALASFTLLEPGITELGVFPEFMTQAQFERHLVFRIMEFEDENTAQSVIEASRIFLTNTLLSKIQEKEQRNKSLRTENIMGVNALILETPLEESWFRVWWRHGKTVFSTFDVSRREDHSKQRERNISISGMLSIYRFNKGHLKIDGEITKPEDVGGEARGSHKEDKLDLGIQLFQKKQYSEAQAVFADFVQSDNNNSEAHRWLGSSKFFLGDYVGAEKELKVATELNPQNSAAFSNLGSIYDKLGQLENAEQAFMKAIELSHMPLDFCNVAAIHRKKGEALLAVASYKLALEADPSFMMAYNCLFKFLMDKSKNLNEVQMTFLVVNCETYFKKGIEKIPSSSTLHSYLAFAYLFQNRKNDAKNEMKKALALNPKDECAQILVGMRL